MLAMEVVQPDMAAKYTVIWLHGLGASGHDFVDIVPQLGKPAQAIRFLFPHAPQRAVTINAGFVMPAWYDILSLDRDGDEDTQGIIQAEALIQEMIEAEIKAGVPSDHILLAGFSQGAALALFTGLRFHKPLMGVIALSGYLPAAETLESTMQADKTMPIMQAHGVKDDVVLFHYARIARQWLSQHDREVAWYEYANMGHSVCLEEVQDIAAFLQNVLPKNG